METGFLIVMGFMAVLVIACVLKVPYADKVLSFLMGKKID